MKNNAFTIVSAIIAVILIGISIFFTLGNKGNESSDKKINDSSSKETVIGDLNSEHSHISFLVILGDELIDLSQPQYMLKDQLVHLENNNGFVIHKHATGMKLSYFLETIGIRITENCLTFDTGEKYCEDSSNKIKLIVNREEVENLLSYEIRNLDKILLDYSDSTELDLRFKFNNILDIPSEFTEPSR